ncbi:DeoR/GlpR family DNA-binding transcription regulator [Pseudohoeflea coraliihabitans]|uniref:DeoR/GlpR family DNA-binding transcription regulator n=1 Tax=Pseudohoeflea coraliihabitans TaxID=2860393 RepID=A0ABS6WSB7_9HYPH|nr:DeoR/GlpR family DNA-binding transcription regulator [Pseudohoeflea sp. DP4N28-3]MBW3098322.1 DeoR/GlpR family DNA-binding transcription regulator [Pseudohoeflea sp. DP4N28-3]
MRPSVRQASIFELIEKRGRAAVEEIAEKYGASPETVRRDLNALAERGLVRKVHGGAVRRAGRGEGLFDERLAENTRAKREIAEKLARAVQPGDSVMIDTGTTTLICAEALARIRDLTVITNSTRIAQVIAHAENGSRALLLGGMFRAGNDQTIGAKTCAEVAGYRVDHVVLTVSALDASGAYDVSFEEAQVARAMIECSENISIVADGSKLRQRATHRVCDLTQVKNLYLNQPADPEFTAALAAAHVRLH